jgi:hypothetical protein
MRCFRFDLKVRNRCPMSEERICLSLVLGTCYERGQEVITNLTTLLLLVMLDAEGTHEKNRILHASVPGFAPRARGIACRRNNE